MPSSYNKYLEYLGHVDDTTKDDFLAREANIRMEVDALKQQCKDELRVEKEKLDVQLKIARDSVVQEQKKASEQLAKKEKELVEITQKLKQEISDLNKQIQINENRAQTTLKDEKERMKKEFSVREAELISANDSLHQEMVSEIKKIQDDAKKKKQETEKKYNQKIKELEQNIANLKSEITSQKQLYEKSAAEQASYYEQIIKQLKEKNEKVSFLDWLKSVFTIKKSDTNHSPRQAQNVSNSSKLIDLLLTRQDLEQNKIGAIGYLFSVIGLMISWVSFLGMCSCLIGIILSDIGRRKPDNHKAMMGIIFGFTGLIVYFLIRWLMLL